MNGRGYGATQGKAGFSPGRSMPYPALLAPILLRQRRDDNLRIAGEELQVELAHLAVEHDGLIHLAGERFGMRIEGKRDTFLSFDYGDLRVGVGVSLGADVGDGV